MLTSRSKKVAITTMIDLAAGVLAQWVPAAGYCESRKDFPQTVQLVQSAYNSSINKNLSLCDRNECHNSILPHLIRI